MKDPDQLGALAERLGGVPIWAVAPGSVAHRAGMRTGDIVMRVNGIATPTLAQYLRAHAESGHGLELEVLRSGVRVRLTLPSGSSQLS